jgi:AAA+ superfamily predicted ATPase
METDHLFDDVLELPDPSAARRYAALVGLDEVKDRLAKEARLVLHPSRLTEWSKRHHGSELPILTHFQSRPPLFVFAGDVGTGKTTLAETFGNPIAREEGIAVKLYRLSLNARGSGTVGEMTQLLAAAFREVHSAAKKASSAKGKAASGLILLIDEADALAQSRELGQMHHEDRAGVNALIRGIDALANDQLPVLIVMCTNRLGALDPAVRRRAAAIFDFDRPTDEQRATVLNEGLKGTGLTAKQISEITSLTGRGDQEYGFTYSDLTQRLLPAIVLDAFPDGPIKFERVRALTAQMKPTPPFNESKS